MSNVRPCRIESFLGSSASSENARNARTSARPLFEGALPSAPRPGASSCSVPTSSGTRAPLSGTGRISIGGALVVRKRRWLRAALDPVFVHLAHSSRCILCPRSHPCPSGVSAVFLGGRACSQAHPRAPSLTRRWSGHPPAGFACLRLPLISNVRPQLLLHRFCRPVHTPASRCSSSTAVSLAQAPGGSLIGRPSKPVPLLSSPAAGRLCSARVLPHTGVMVTVAATHASSAWKPAPNPSFKRTAHGKPWAAA